MTGTLAPEQRRSVALFSTGSITTERPRLSWKKQGTKNILGVSDMAVFRSGTFRDSMGFQHTWEDLHIQQMVTNFQYLRNQQVFAEVPVRKGHPSFLSDPMETLIGWHTDLKAEVRTSPHDGEEYTYLLASYDVFDESAQKRIENNDWRNRSSEIGFYLTNAEAEFWPVYMGFAFVDIPAVEGLNGFSKALKEDTSFSVMFEKEAPVSGNKKQHSTPEPESPQGVSPGDSGQGVENPSDQSPDTNPEASGESTPAEESDAGQADQGGTQESGSDAGDDQSGEHSRSGAFAFQINGQSMSDFAAVQQHITALESFRTDTISQRRADFVSQLAKDKKIAATQVDGLTKVAQGLSDEQFQEWSAAYESGPTLSLFEQHGTTPGEDGGPSASPSSDKNVRIETLKEIISMHRRSHMSEEQVKATASYKELMQLTSSES